MKTLCKLAVLAILGALFLSGCSSDATDSIATGSGSTPTSDAATPPVTATHRAGTARLRTAAADRASHANSLLKRLRVAPETSAANYDRAAFPLWIAQGACDTREEVLIREREQGAPQSCDVRRGKWFSAYDGLTITNPSKLDIDHVVPLQQAFVSGASKWDLSTRKQFANDLGYAGSLRAVSAASNRSKGSDDPARWMPPRSAFRCSYVGTWIAIKFRWQLKVDQAEMSTLKLWVNKCGSHSDVRKPKRVRVSFSRRDLARPTRRKHARARGKGSDPRFATCAEAKSHGYGPYRSGADPEYNWYRDSDGDGRNCE